MTLRTGDWTHERQPFGRSFRAHCRSMPRPNPPEMGFLASFQGSCSAVIPAPAGNSTDDRGPTFRHAIRSNSAVVKYVSAVAQRKRRETTRLRTDDRHHLQAASFALCVCVSHTSRVLAYLRIPLRLHRQTLLPHGARDWNVQGRSATQDGVDFSMRSDSPRFHHCTHRTVVASSNLLPRIVLRRTQDSLV